MDRCKHIFKLSQGEYVAPERIESVYLESRFVSQVFVDGDAEQTYPVAIVVPEVESLIEHVNSKHSHHASSNGNGQRQHRLANGDAGSPRKSSAANAASSCVAGGDDERPVGQSAAAKAPPAQEETAANTTYVVHGKAMTMEQLCGYQPAIKAVFDDIINLGRVRGLKGFEQVCS